MRGRRRECHLGPVVACLVGEFGGQFAIGQHVACGEHHFLVGLGEVGAARDAQLGQLPAFGRRCLVFQQLVERERMGVVFPVEGNLSSHNHGLFGVFVVRVFDDLA